MAVIITSPNPGSLRITNTSASPLTSYWDNLSTVNVFGSIYPPAEQDLCIANNNQVIIFQTKLSNITSIGASGAGVITNLQNAVDALSSLISH